MSITPGIRAELDQTAEWWDGQYRALERARIPRGAAYHQEHALIDVRTYGGVTARRICSDCGVTIDPYAD